MLEAAVDVLRGNEDVVSCWVQQFLSQVKTVMCRARASEANRQEVAASFMSDLGKIPPIARCYVTFTKPP